MGVTDYTKRTGVALTQMLNALLGGWPDESVSSRAHRCKGASRRWALAARLINAGFFLEADHCAAAYEAERSRRHFPPELRGDSAAGH